MRTDQTRTKLTKIILTAGLLLTLLAACAPTRTVPPETATVAPTATATVTATTAPTFTAIPSPTLTATLSPEEAAEAAQAAIRAEILAAGVNLDDLANSENEWVRNHLAIETIQNYIDNLNFGREDAGAITTVVIGLEAVENLEELEQAITTDTGWKLTTFAKLAYKDINGDWQIIKVPLSAYHPADDLFWIKDVSTRGGSFFMDGEEIIKPDDNGVLKLPLIHIWLAHSNNAKYHSGVGSFIKFFTGWIGDPKYANNDCVLGDPPRYSEEQLIEFRQTGDPSIFGYQDSDGYYILWPLVSFNADLSALSSYDQD